MPVLACILAGKAETGTRTVNSGCRIETFCVILRDRDDSSLRSNRPYTHGDDMALTGLCVYGISMWWVVMGPLKSSVAKQQLAKEITPWQLN